MANKWDRGERAAKARIAIGTGVGASVGGVGGYFGLRWIDKNIEDVDFGNGLDLYLATLSLTILGAVIGVMGGGLWGINRHKVITGSRD